MLTTFFANLSNQRKAYVRIEAANHGHRIGFDGCDGSEVQIVLSREVLCELYQAIMGYGPIKDAFHDALTNVIVAAQSKARLEASIGKPKPKAPAKKRRAS